MKLTEASIQRAKAGEYADTMAKGLRLIVSTTGAKSWEYRYKFDTRLRRIRLGQYPAVGLSDARKRWEAAKGKRDDGIDPHEQRDQDRAAVAAMAAAEKAALVKAQYTVSVMAAAYLEHKGKSTKTAHSYKNIAHFIGRVVAALGDVPAAAVTRSQCRDVFDKYAETPIAANRMLQWARAMWNHAMAREKVNENPWDRIDQHPETPKDRTLTKAEIRKVMASTHDALKLILLTGCRPGEIVQSHASMFDPEEQTLTLTDTKNGSTHVVYLSRQAWAIVAPRLNGWLFPSKTGRALRVDTLAAIVQRLEWGFTPHDCRRTMATWLGEQEQCGPGVIERMLNHKIGGVTRRHYNLAKLNSPAQRWWQAWADHVTGLEAVNVVELRHG